MYVQYVTISSSTGATVSSQWKTVGWYVTPINLGITVNSTSGNYQIDVTMDDPTRTYPNPTLASSIAVTVFPSTACAGGGITPGTGNAIGVITQPIAAWRLTSTSTTAGGTITATVLQAGIG